ncbi:IPTL-CTERM sorting domain-containing protein [Elongatibacter sediminis]|uniref:IPTL-CTERM sorting domain-containing protein n=1 Tax=Elongatibacter sediminis TaxID=3119006 RepID=A0AAW9RE48_9GAMM
MNAIKKITLISAVLMSANAWASVEIVGFTVNESAGTGTWDVTVTPGQENPAGAGVDVQLDYQTRDGTAEDENGDDDYKSKSGTLDFSSDSTQQITIDIVQDTKIEGDETLYVDLFETPGVKENPAGPAEPAATGTGTIIDDDVTLTVLVQFPGGDNPPVEIFLDCNGNGTIDDDTKPVVGGMVTFDVTNYTDPLNCTAVPVNTPSGYAVSSSDCDPGLDDQNTQCNIAFAETRVTFTVQKLFMDGNDNTDVELNISCNTGLPLDQSRTATLKPGPLGSPQTYEVEFVVQDFDDGELDCTVWETPVPGYIPSYNCDNDVGGTCDAGDEFDVYSGAFIDGDVDDYFDGPCVYENLSPSGGADQSNWDTLCVIRNYPAPVEVEIDKLWVIEGSSTLDGINPDFQVFLGCDSQIIDADIGSVSPEPPAESPQGGAYPYWVEFDVNFLAEPTDLALYASVIPGYPSSSCTVDETVWDPAVEVDNNCGTFEISVGNGRQCTITNTVFYEGIPTLNQYGLALLALLMLGVGFVGFRRFA